jgi:hypothetical protein
MKALIAPLAMLCVGASNVQRTVSPSGLIQPLPVESCREPGPEPAIPSTAPPNSTYLAAENGIPDRYATGDLSTRINIVSIDEANRICAGGVPVCRRVFYACEDNGVLTMPNPCEYPRSDPYAKLLCHETAHLRGWPAYHGN